MAFESYSLYTILCKITFIAPINVTNKLFDRIKKKIKRLHKKSDNKIFRRSCMQILWYLHMQINNESISSYKLWSTVVNIKNVKELDIVCKVENNSYKELVFLCKCIQEIFGSNIQELIGHATLSHIISDGKCIDLNDISYLPEHMIKNRCRINVTEPINELFMYDKVWVSDSPHLVITNYGINNKEYQNKVRKDSLVRELDMVDEEETVPKRMKT